MDRQLEIFVCLENPTTMGAVRSAWPCTHPRRESSFGFVFLNFLLPLVPLGLNVQLSSFQHPSWSEEFPFPELRFPKEIQEKGGARYTGMGGKSSLLLHKWSLDPLGTMGMMLLIMIQSQSNSWWVTLNNRTYTRVTYSLWDKLSCYNSTAIVWLQRQTNDCWLFYSRCSWRCGSPLLVGTINSNLLTFIAMTSLENYGLLRIFIQGLLDLAGIHTSLAGI